MVLNQSVLLRLFAEHKIVQKQRQRTFMCVLLALHTNEVTSIPSGRAVAALFERLPHHQDLTISIVRSATNDLCDMGLVQIDRKAKRTYVIRLAVSLAAKLVVWMEQTTDWHPESASPPAPASKPEKAIEVKSEPAPAVDLPAEPDVTPTVEALVPLLAQLIGWVQGHDLDQVMEGLGKGIAAYVETRRHLRAELETELGQAQARVTQVAGQLEALDQGEPVTPAPRPGIGDDADDSRLQADLDELNGGNGHQVTERTWKQLTELQAEIWLAAVCRPKVSLTRKVIMDRFKGNVTEDQIESYIRTSIVPALTLLTRNIDPDLLSPAESNFVAKMQTRWGFDNCRRLFNELGTSTDVRPGDVDLLKLCEEAASEPRNYIPKNVLRAIRKAMTDQRRRHARHSQTVPFLDERTGSKSSR